MTARVSITIRNLRIPLMIMVVFIHSYLIKNTEMRMVSFVEDFFSKCVPVFAVPLFMFFAGYLFFCKFKEYSVRFFISQIKKRIRTLLVPYIIWNGLVILIFWALHTFTPSLINPSFENVGSFSFCELVDCFIGAKNGFPIAYQFWFIRDLMAIVLFTPIICILARQRYFGLIFPLMMLFTCTNSYLELGVYFMLGTWFQLNNMDFTELPKGVWYSSIVTTIALLFFFAKGGESLYLRRLYILSGSIAILNWSYIRKINVVNSLMERYSAGAFFLFALHGIIDLVSCKIINQLITTQNQLIWISLYFLNIFAVIIICLGLYNLFKRLSPMLLSFLTGNR